MFRPLRLVLTVVSFGVIVGFLGLRFAAPSPTGSAFDGQMNAALKLYGALYSWVEDAPMPDFENVFASSFFGNGPQAPEVGTPGFSDSQMGQSLADLRERQTGIPSGSIGLSDVARQVQSQFDGLATFDDVSKPSGPPPAQPRRLVVGE